MSGPLYLRPARAPRPQDTSSPTPAVLLYFEDVAPYLAHRFWRPLALTEHALEELTGVALEAVCTARNRFDPERGVKFSTYATSLVQHAMKDWQRRSDHLRRAARDHVDALIRDELERATAEGRPITRDQAEFRVVPPHLLAPQCGDDRRGSSTEAPGLFSKGDTVLEQIPDPDADPHEDHLVRDRDERVHVALLRLPVRWQRIVVWRYWMGYSLAQCAELDARQEQRAQPVSLSRINQLETSALKRMRRELGGRV